MMKDLIGKFAISRGDTPWSPLIVNHIVGYYEELVLDEDNVEVHTNDNNGVLVTASIIAGDSIMFTSANREDIAGEIFNYEDLTEPELEIVSKLISGVQQSKIKKAILEGVDNEFSLIDKKACARYKKAPSREKVKAQLENLKSRKGELYHMIDGFYEP